MKKRNENLKTFGSEGDSPNSVNAPSFFCESNSNTKLMTNINTLSDLKVYLKLKYISYAEAGLRAGISECRVRQILIAYDLPKRAKLIQQIAEGWGINEIKLAQLFEQARK